MNVTSLSLILERELIQSLHSGLIGKFLQLRPLEESEV